MFKKVLFIWLFACCAITGMAQELEITQPFKRLEHASVLASYRNEFGSFRKPALDIEFPYALIRLELEGDEHAVLKAKEKFSVYMGQHHSIQSKITDRDNEILFLVPSGAGHIELKCGDGCASQLLLDLPRLQADAIYHGKVRYMPAAPVKDNTEGPESQFFKFRVTPQTSVVTLVINGQEENIPMRGEGIASTRLKYGTYQYRITAERYYTEEGTITVSSSQTDMSVTLRPRFGWLTIKADNTSQGAFVFATNTQTNVVKQLGTLPLSSKEMDSGEYTLRIQKEKYKDYTTVVTIKDGETTTLSANLLPNFAHVTLTTNSDAEIFLDGTSMGRGSWSGTIELGEHSVETRQTSHCSAYTTININAQSAGRSIALNNPVPIYGSLLVDGSPVDASVYVDGRKVGNAPTVVNKLLVGSHQVRIEKEGYAKQEKSVQITEGQEAVMDYALTKVMPKQAPASASTGEHEYVDLGLSVKWATCNVGASKPEDYGDYFAWGETEPQHTYDWSTYKWCKGSYDTQTKYCRSSGFGTVDNKKTLELSDDAARANWGGNWRMPTTAEQDELRKQCTWIWTIKNGVNGYKVTSKSNGKSIFLPAAGYRRGSSLGYAGSSGYYWSSSLYTGGPSGAYYLYFDSSGVDWRKCNRYYGLSVRPVCP